MNITSYFLFNARFILCANKTVVLKNGSKGKYWKYLKSLMVVLGFLNYFEFYKKIALIKNCKIALIKNFNLEPSNKNNYFRI